MDSVKDAIANSIKMWEPRIAVSQIEVTNSADSIEPSLNPDDKKEDIGHVLLIRILFTDFDNIQQVQELKLEVPLGG